MKQGRLDRTSKQALKQHEQSAQAQSRVPEMEIIVPYMGTIV